MGTKRASPLYEVKKTRCVGTGVTEKILSSNPRRIVVIVTQPSASSVSVSLNTFAATAEAMFPGAVNAVPLSLTKVLHGPIVCEEYYAQAMLSSVFWTIEVIELP